MYIDTRQNQANSGVRYKFSVRKKQIYRYARFRFRVDEALPLKFNIIPLVVIMHITVTFTAMTCCNCKPV